MALVSSFRTETRCPGSVFPQGELCKVGEGREYVVHSMQKPWTYYKYVYKLCLGSICEKDI